MRQQMRQQKPIATQYFLSLSKKYLELWLDLKRKENNFRNIPFLHEQYRSSAKKH